MLLLLLMISRHGYAQEICDNGIDDDADGLIDLNDDTDCICNAVINGEIESLIPNPSFEEHSCIPLDFSYLDCASGWVQATEATSDYFLVEGNNFSMFNTPLPIPDGIGIVGFIVSYSVIPGMPDFYYEEYVGTCLLSPMEAGTQYTIMMYLAGSSIDGSGVAETNGAFYGPLDITIFGSASCPDWPVVNDLGCPVGTDDWTELGHVSYQADETWQQVAITFTPEFDVQSVMIGGPCTLPESFQLGKFSSIYPYFWIDNLILNTSASFNSLVVQTGSFCTDDVVLHGQPDSLFTSFQWYYQGVALAGETDSLLMISDLGLTTGTYQFMAMDDDTTCSTFEFELLPPTEVMPEITNSVDLGCAPLTTTFENVNSDEIVGWLWEFGDGGSDTAQSPTYTYEVPGIYDITLTVTTHEGCEFLETFDDVVNVLEPPISAFTLTPEVGCSPMEVVFTNQSQFADNYSWELGDGDVYNIDHTDAFSHEYLASNQEFVYTVELIAMRNPDCADTSSATLVTSVCGCMSPDALNFSPLAGIDDGSCIFPQASILVPNVFTPNQDSQNPRFEIWNEYLKYIRLVIYDRWGNLVFEKESNSPDSSNPAWDGTYGGTEASAGVYYFLYEAKGLSNETFEGEGFFHLLRD